MLRTPVFALGAETGRNTVLRTVLRLSKDCGLWPQAARRALGLDRDRFAKGLQRRQSRPMKNGFRSLPATLLVVVALSAQPVWSQARGPLPPAVQAALDKAQVPADALAATVIPLQRWSPKWEHRAGQLMQPASTMKLVTSIVALDRLGPNHRGFTEVMTAAPIDGDVLRGDLVLRGGADPELGLPQLWQLLIELREQGLREISGDLLLDRSLFRPARIDIGVPPFDESMEFAYNGIPDALQLTNNLLAIEIKSDGGGVRARTLPTIAGIEFDASAMTLSSARCADWDDDWQFPAVSDDGSTVRINLRGPFPKDCTARTELQLFDRSRLAGLTFASMWQRLGGSWRGVVREATAPEGARVLVRRDARPWGELLRPLNKTSDNLLTRLLFLQIGQRAMASDIAGDVPANLPASSSGKVPGNTPVNPTLLTTATTLERADREVLRWFSDHRIDATGIVPDNGSGLSRSARISPRQLAQMLVVAHQSKYASDLLMSLPVAGVDGTMRNRLKTSPAAGWARLKTGTLRNVTALAGIVPDHRGRPQVLVAMVNHDNAAKARPVLDALVEWVARGRPPAARAPGEGGP